jgi:hypothetical protein
MSARRLLLILLGASLWLLAAERPSYAQATFTHTVCIKVRAGHVDAATGDFGTGSTWVGRGIKFYAFGAKRYTDESDGCSTFTSTTGGGLTTMIIYAESKIGGTDNITVRSFETLADLNTWNGNPTDNNLPQWVWTVLPQCSGTTCTTTLTNTSNQADVVSNLHSAGVWTIYNIDKSTSARLAGTRTVFLHNSGCLSATDGSCQMGDVLAIQPDWDGARRKFLIGHEAGHWLHHQWIGGAILAGTSGWYDVQNPPGTACDSVDVPGDHGLRSLEREIGAFAEGVAHFLSTLAYNDHDETDGAFHYYKDIGPYDFDVVDVEHGPTGGDDNVYANVCGCPASCSYTDSMAGAVQAHQLGTELDWLRAYWDFRTNASPGSKPTHRQIFDHLSDTYDASASHYGLTDTHDRLESDLPAGLVDRWDFVMDFNGADNTPE